jgi:hypothetical protein
MPQHNMWEKNWPPGPENQTGVGLHWTFFTKGSNKPPLTFVCSNSREPFSTTC